MQRSAGTGSPQEAIRAATEIGLPAGIRWLWTISFPEDHPVHSLLLHYLAARRGIGWDGKRLAARYDCWRKDREAPRRTTFRDLAKTLCLDRKTVSLAMRWLIGKGWLTRSKSGAWEPLYAVMRDRYAKSTPESRFKVAPSVLVEHGPTAALVHGKVAKTDGMAKVTFRQTTRSLAAAIGYSMRTMRRHASNLVACGLLSVFGRTRWGRYLSLGLSSPRSSEDEKVIDARDALKELFGLLLPHLRAPPSEAQERAAANRARSRSLVSAARREPTVAELDRMAWQAAADAADARRAKATIPGIDDLPDKVWKSPEAKALFELNRRRYR